jgi:hypothetical protein
MLVAARVVGFPRTLVDAPWLTLAGTLDSLPPADWRHREQGDFAARRCTRTREEC